jgi:glycosidase
VRVESNKIARFWLQDMGVDGFRLDAIPYLVEEGDKLAGTPATHALLRDYERYVRGIAPRAFTIGEVWDSIGAVLPYYPDQLDAHFAFEVSDALLDAVRSGSASKLYPGYLRLQHALPPDRWSPFLRNHDQARTLTVLGGDVARAKVAATLLLTLPGFPFVYYGEEIGMTGDKPDPRLRTPMHWRPGPAAGFTRGLPWEPLQPDSLTANVEAQDRDSTSLLNLYRRLIQLRAQNSALAVGELVPLTTSSDAVAAFVRRDGAKVVLVIANLGTTPVAGVMLNATARLLPTGSYSSRTLLGIGPAAPLTTGADGSIHDYVPVRSLPPMTSYIFELVSTVR